MGSQYSLLMFPTSPQHHQSQLSLTFTLQSVQELIHTCTIKCCYRPSCSDMLGCVVFRLDFTTLDQKVVLEGDGGGSLLTVLALKSYIYHTVCFSVWILREKNYFEFTSNFVMATICTQICVLLHTLYSCLNYPCTHCCTVIKINFICIAPFFQTCSSKCLIMKHRWIWVKWDS